MKDVDLGLRTRRFEFDHKSLSKSSFFILGSFLEELTLKMCTLDLFQLDRMSQYRQRERIKIVVHLIGLLLLPLFTSFDFQWHPCSSSFYAVESRFSSVHLFLGFLSSLCWYPLEQRCRCVKMVLPLQMQEEMLTWTDLLVQSYMLCLFMSSYA